MLYTNRTVSNFILLEKQSNQQKWSCLLLVEKQRFIESLYPKQYLYRLPINTNNDHR